MLRNEGTKRKNGARLFFASIILFATLLATASGVSLAKIFSSSNGGDNAQVSVMVVDLKGSSSDNLTIDCGQGIATASYNFAITNTKDGKTAELSFKYDVIVSLPEALSSAQRISRNLQPITLKLAPVMAKRLPSGNNKLTPMTTFGVRSSMELTE
mgnify:CR=1 FL=1